MAEVVTEDPTTTPEGTSEGEPEAAPESEPEATPEAEPDPAPAEASAAEPVTATVGFDATGIYAVDVQIGHGDQTVIRVNGRSVWQGVP